MHGPTTRKCDEIQAAVELDTKAITDIGLSLCGCDTGMLYAPKLTNMAEMKTELLSA